MQIDTHLTPALFSRPDRIQEPLYVVTTVFNATRWRSRWRHYQDFAKRCDEARVKLYTVEVAFGERDFVVTQRDNPCHVQLRTDQEIWLKENAINLGVQRLPQDWKYMAWIDADVSFIRDDWANETLHRLQHYAVVQMFEEAIDLTSEHTVLRLFRSFMYAYREGILTEQIFPLDYPYELPGQAHSRFCYWHHPGFAWAIRREAFDALGGLYDKAIAGEADNVMACSLIGQAKRILTAKTSAAYTESIRRWERKAEQRVHRNVGYVPGAILHYWHGQKAKRQYTTRKQILVDTQFDPYRDLRRDWQGLYAVVDAQSPRYQKLRDLLRQYFHSRDEDAPTPDDQLHPRPGDADGR